MRGGETPAPREALKQYRYCGLRIQSKQRKIQRLREQALGLSLGNQEQPPAGDHMARIVEAYVDMERELEREVLSLKELQTYSLSLIHKLEDGRQKTVLELYYIEGLTLEEVAGEMHYSCMQVNRIHKSALGRLGL